MKRNRIMGHILNKSLQLFCTTLYSQQPSAKLPILAYRTYTSADQNLAVDMRHITTDVCVVTFYSLLHAGSYIIPTSLKLCVKTKRQKYFSTAIV